MQPVQIAMSGVTPGTYGNSTQIPSFTVDARGRLVWAANIDIQPILNVKVNDDIKTILISTENLNFVDSPSIVFEQNVNGISASLKNDIAISRAILKNEVGVVDGDIRLSGNFYADQIKSTVLFAQTLKINKIISDLSAVYINNNIAYTHPDTGDHKVTDLYVNEFGSVSKEKIRTSRGDQDNRLSLNKDDEIFRTAHRGYSNNKSVDAICLLTTLYDVAPNFSGRYSIIPLLNKNPVVFENGTYRGITEREELNLDSLALNVTVTGIGVGVYNPKASLDVNGLFKLTPQTVAPVTPYEGMIAVADGINWNPAPSSSAGSYPVYYNGQVWARMTS
jgi:hypothetical protein